MVLYTGRTARTVFSHDNPIRAPIISLTEDGAREVVHSLFDEEPDWVGGFFDEEAWTLAIVEDLKVEDLPPGRLMWVLGNGMPLRPDFSISVNGDGVRSKLDKAAVVGWDFGSPKVVDVIRSRWSDAVKKGDFSEHPEFGCDMGLDPNAPNDAVPFVRFAELGIVWGSVRLFDETLLKYRSSDHGRSHGFFLVIRGRLTNPDDEQLYLPDPSFQTFYRSQFVIHADGLDDELLADRQRLRHDGAIEELQLLQKALAGVARTATEARDAEKDDGESTRSVLPVGSRVFYRDPMSALLFREEVEDIGRFDLGRVAVERKELGSGRPIAVVAVEESAFHVNSSHPYFEALSKRTGQSRAARELLRTMDLFAISERLLEGHLLDIGIGDDEVAEVVEWREGLFRQLASSYDRTPELINEMYRASYVGGNAFEKATARVFEDMGFVAEHDGRSGKKDVLVVATVGPEGYRFILEAKGSNGDVDNQTAAVSGAANHRNEVGAEFAIIVARKFAGFGRSGDREGAALLEECAATGGVSVLEVDSVERLDRAIVRFSYPLPLVRNVLREPETPAQKRARIEQLEAPAGGFDYSRLLEQLWLRQREEARDDVVPYRAVYQQEGWRDRLGFDDFERRVIALETLAGGRIKLKHTEKTVYLRQAPQLIVDQIERSLQGEGHDVVEPTA